MNYCINPTCSAPDKNSSSTNVCLSCGQTVLLKDRYRAQQLLGQGGFGKTFKATDEDLPRKPLCVIKQFAYPNTEPQLQLVALQLFYEEARHLETLGSHPQIPELLAYFDVDGQPYLIQEFIDGQDLQQELKTNGVFDRQHVRALLASLLPVLDFLHHSSIPVIHRDLKPANIIRRRSDNQLVLVDFGAAKLATQSILAKTGTTIGSPEFSAPEQIKGKPTFASDLFSLGVTCIYLLTHVSPFDLFDVSSDEWIWRDYLPNPVDRQLGEVLDKMIANSLPRRYQSAAEVLKALNIERSTQFSSQPFPDLLQSADRLTAEEYYKSASSKEQGGDFTGALADFNKAIELDPKYAIAYSHRGWLKHDKLNDVSGAMADFNKAIELDPKYAIAYKNRGSLKEDKLNDVSGALADFNKAISLAPKFVITYRFRGWLKRNKLNDVSGALADFNKAISLAPDDAIDYSNRGWLKHNELNDALGAMADYNKAIELDPKYAIAYLYRGWLKHDKLNDVSGAMADYNKAIELAPDDADTYHYRGWLKHDKLNDVSGAMADYNKAIELAPDDADNYRIRGLLKKNKLNDALGAMSDYHKAIELNPHNAIAYKYRGQLKHNLSSIKGFDRVKKLVRNSFSRNPIKLNDVSGALADFNKAIELAPDDANTYNHRGWLKKDKLNDVSGAFADYSKAIELNAEYANAYYCRGQLRADTIKDRTGAIQDLRRAASLYRQQDGSSKYIGWSIDYLKQLGVTE